jgi:hypothetical protein
MKSSPITRKVPKTIAAARPIAPTNANALRPAEEAGIVGTFMRAALSNALPQLRNAWAL